MQLNPTCHHLLRACIASSSTPDQPAQSDESNSNDSTKNQPKYRGVVSCHEGRQWAAMVEIPKYMLPGCNGSALHAAYGFTLPEAAARKADVMRLALRGKDAHQFLNFPACEYTEQQIAEQLAEFLNKHPNFDVHATGRYSMRQVPYSRGLKDGIAEAAKRVARLHDGSRELVGVFRTQTGKFKVTLTAGRRSCYAVMPTLLEAACAYDVFHMALHGPTHSVNFPPDAYDDSLVQTAGHDIQLTYPGMIEAAQLVLAAPDYYCSEAGRTANAAVAAEAAAATAAGVEVSKAAVGCFLAKDGSARAAVRSALTGTQSKLQFNRSYQSNFTNATCAADLMQLVLGRPAVNLPGHNYKDGSVAAMRAWMELQARRKAEWAAKKKQIEQPKQRRKRVTGKQLGRG